MSIKESATYTARDKIETILHGVLTELDKEKKLEPAKTNAKTEMTLDIKTILLGSIFVAFISVLASCTTCLFFLL